MDKGLTPQEQDSIYTVFAIDQSTTAIGYSIWENNELLQYRAFEIEEDLTPEERINQISIWFEGALEQLLYQENSDIVILFEQVVLHSRVDGGARALSNTRNSVITFQILSMLLGVLINICINYGIEYELVKPSEWKELLGIESKLYQNQKIEEMELIEELFGLYANELEVDAICIGYAYIKENSNI